MLVIIEEASRRIPHTVVLADAQNEECQLGGGSEKNTGQASLLKPLSMDRLKVLCTRDIAAKCFYESLN